MKLNDGRLVAASGNNHSNFHLSLKVSFSNRSPWHNFRQGSTSGPNYRVILLLEAGNVSGGKVLVVGEGGRIEEQMIEHACWWLQNLQICHGSLSFKLLLCSWGTDIFLHSIMVGNWPIMNTTLMLAVKCQVSSDSELLCWVPMTVVCLEWLQL